MIHFLLYSPNTHTLHPLSSYLLPLSGEAPLKKRKLLSEFLYSSVISSFAIQATYSLLYNANVCLVPKLIYLRH